MKKILEFCGTPELLIALLYSDDVCQTIKSEIMASGKVTMFVFAEDEPCYTPDSDDIKPQGNLGDPVEDDLHWNEHHEARMDRIGQNGPDGFVYDVFMDHEDEEAMGR